MPATVVWRWGRRWCRPRGRPVRPGRCSAAASSGWAAACAKFCGCRRDRADARSPDRTSSATWSRAACSRRLPRPDPPPLRFNCCIHQYCGFRIWRKVFLIAMVNKKSSRPGLEDAVLQFLTRTAGNPAFSGTVQTCDFFKTSTILCDSLKCSYGKYCVRQEGSWVLQVQQST